jgi:hypothetical protein
MPQWFTTRPHLPQFHHLPRFCPNFESINLLNHWLSQSPNDLVSGNDLIGIWRGVIYQSPRCLSVQSSWQSRWTITGNKSPLRPSAQFHTHIHDFGRERAYSSQWIVNGVWHLSEDHCHGLNWAPPFNCFFFPVHAVHYIGLVYLNPFFMSCTIPPLSAG